MKSQFTQLILVLVTVALAARYRAWQDPRQELSQCKANVKAIGTAAEMYCMDNANHYPATLHHLEGRYLKKLPTCPTTGSDYSQSYRVLTSPDTYSFGCQGRHHPDPRPGDELHPVDLPLGYPWVDAESGLISHP